VSKGWIYNVRDVRNYPMPRHFALRLIRQDLRFIDLSQGY
jgi:hypothetical protein